MRYTNITTKDGFQSYLEWTGQHMEQTPTRSSSVRSWQIRDRFMNQWDLIFNGNVGEFTIKGTHDGVTFVVAMYLSGDKFEIVEAFDNGRHIRADRLLKKYRDLGLMASNYFRFGYLKI